MRHAFSKVLTFFYSLAHVFKRMLCNKKQGYQQNKIAGKKKAVCNRCVYYAQCNRVTCFRDVEHRMFNNNNRR